MLNYIFGVSFFPVQVLPPKPSLRVPKSPGPGREANQMHPELPPQGHQHGEGRLAHCQPVSRWNGEIHTRNQRERGACVAFGINPLDIFFVRN